MAKYVVKRVLLAILTIFIVSAITFFSMYAIPGGPFSSEKALSPAVMAALEARYGLDQPVPVQYVNYMSRLLFQADFGVSLKTGRDVFETITTGMQVSAKLGLSAAAVAIAFGLVLGSVAALNRGKFIDRIVVFFTTLATSAPSFVLAILDGESGEVVESGAIPAARQVFSARTAQRLQQLLTGVVAEGTGRQGAPIHGSAAGKTGTAQTGQFDAAGEELLNYWFSGFYPAGEPRYVITVLQDATLEPQTSSAAVFACVADALHALENG